MFPSSRRFLTRRQHWPKQPDRSLAFRQKDRRRLLLKPYLWPHLWIVLLLLALAGCGGGSTVPRSAECLDNLDHAGIDYATAAIDASSSACLVDNPVRIRKAEIAWNPPGLVSCGFALRLDTFTREVAEPLAERYFGAPIRSMRQFGTYSCRRETGNKDRMSEHAVGLAIDVAGFELADGTFISVEKDWRRAGPKREFLHALAQAACQRFSVVLTPDSNREHYNHIHIDAGPYRLCGA